MALAAPAWRWVDQNGQVHYSDRPVPGATQIDLPAPQASGAPPQAQPSSATSATTAASPPTATERYASVEIVSPAEQETLRGEPGTVTVQVSFQPPLQAAHRFDIAVDGQRRNLAAATTSVTLPNVFRGQHTLQAIVLDATGREVARSPVRTFFIQQVSTQNPNSPLRRRPAANRGN